MTHTVWELEHRHSQKPLVRAEQIDLFRAHFEIQRMKEEDQKIPRQDRSFLYLQEKGEKSVLLVHGGHSTPSQFIELGKQLYHAGMTVYGTLLPNEESVGTQQGGVPWQLSLAELMLRYDLLSLYGSPIHVVGSSFGAVLALRLALEKPVESLTLLSPPLKPQLKLNESLSLAWGSIFKGRFEKQVADTPHRWMADRYRAVRDVRRKLGDIKCPVLAYHARDNRELTSAGLRALERSLKNVSARLIDEGGHRLLEGPAAADLRRGIVEFVRSGKFGD